MGAVTGLPEEILNECQMKALKKAILWYTVDSQNYFRLTGYAGCGKTFMTKFIIQQLGLSENQVAYAAYTGAAAINLVKKGNNNATTIHKLIYNCHVEYKHISYDPPKFNKNGEEEYKDIKKYIHIEKRSMLPEDLKLIIIDEFSMIPPSMIQDIFSFKIKTLFLGDPGQLPPVFEGKEDNPYYKFAENNEAHLDTIVRQSEDSPIIDMSFMARNKIAIPYNKYGNNVSVLPYDYLEENNDFALKQFLSVDQIICGYNRTRKKVNSVIRTYYNYDKQINYEKYNDEQKKMEYINVSAFIPKVGEKLICTLNNWELTAYSPKLESAIALTNGSIWYVIKVNFVDYKNKIFSLDLKSDFDDECTIKNCLIDFFNFDPEIKYYHPKDLSGAIYNVINFDDAVLYKNTKINQFDYGYAITCHKSQGNQFEKVLVIAERLITGNEKDDNGYRKDNPDIDKKWLYTAITRAETKLKLFIPKSYYMNSEYQKDSEFWNNWRYFYK